MSRHVIASGPIEVVVGWDSPLNTYFATVFDITKDEDDPRAELLWIGASRNEINDIDRVCKAVAPCFWDTWYGSGIAIRLTLPDSWPMWAIERDVAVTLAHSPIEWPNDDPANA